MFQNLWGRNQLSERMTRGVQFQVRNALSSHGVDRNCLRLDPWSGLIFHSLRFFKSPLGLQIHLLDLGLQIHAWVFRSPPWVLQIHTMDLQIHPFVFKSIAWVFKSNLCFFKSTPTAGGQKSLPGPSMPFPGSWNPHPCAHGVDPLRQSK